MFYYLIGSALMFRWVLIAAAVIPAVVLLVQVYKSDKLEKEPPRFLVSLAVSGVIATFLALISEKLLSLILNFIVPQQTALYKILLYFLVIAVSEEGSKYFLLKKRTWNNREFNCLYDGVVYSMFISLGFALWENISYVTKFGFRTAMLRAFTAVPGHACFGVFMGLLYGIAKKFDFIHREKRSKKFRVLSVVVPVLLHGFYDYVASSVNDYAQWIFLCFIAIMFVVSFLLVRKFSKNDEYIDGHSTDFEIIS